MSISLYDLLDVDEAATDAEIRAAWKSAIADLDPTDRRFRAYNDAAAVLLDADRRAAYDAERAGVVDEPVADEPVEDEPVDAPVVLDKPDGDGGGDDGDDGDGDPVVTTTTGTTDTTDATDTTDTTDTTDSGRARRITLAVSAALAVLSAVVLVVVLALPGTGEDNPSERAEQSSAGTDAAGAAEAMAPIVLAYDHRTFDEDVAAAAAYFTEDFGDEQEALLRNLRSDVIERKVSVTTVVSGTGVTLVSPSGNTAKVTLFVDQETRSADEEPRVLRSTAVFDMVREDGSWLLDGICARDCT